MRNVLFDAEVLLKLIDIIISTKRYFYTVPILSKQLLSLNFCKLF